MEVTQTIEDLHLGFVVQCASCQDIFTRHDFPAHICESLASQDDVQPQQPEAPIKSKDQAVVRHPCMSLLEDNWSRIRKLIKEMVTGGIITDDVIEPPGVGTLTDAQGSTECHICFRKLSSKPALAKHLAKHEAEPKETSIPAKGQVNTKTGPLLDYDVCFVCLLCGRAFSNVDQCEDHLWNSDSHQEIKSESIITGHHHSLAEDPSPCEESMRMDAVVLKSVFQCEFCDYVFARKEDLLKHEATHDPKLGYICTACEINSASTREIQQHWQLQCPFIASRNQKQSPPAPTLIGTASAKICLATDFVCNVCFETFPSLDILYDHRHKENHYFPRYSHFDEVLLVGCEVCGDMFDSCAKYCEHYEVNHTRRLKTQAARNRQYLCDVCGKTYTQSSHLWQHLRFHQGVKPFKCSVEGCERRFTIRPDLNDHVRKFHTHERPYQCLVCGQRFLTGSVFYQHRLIHRGERRYECDTCQKRFFRADALKNHKRIHTGEKPFQCMVCAKSFRQRGDCQKHMEVRHMKRGWGAGAGGP